MIAATRRSVRVNTVYEVKQRMEERASSARETWREHSARRRSARSCSRSVTLVSSVKGDRHRVTSPYYYVPIPAQQLKGQNEH